MSISKKQARIIQMFIRDDVSFYSDIWKEIYGSRPGIEYYEWFMSLSSEERQDELKKLCAEINVQIN